MLYVLGCLVVGVAVLSAAKHHARAVDLIVICLPVAAVVGGASRRANLSPADLFLPFALVAIALQLVAERRKPTYRPRNAGSHAWPTYLIAVSVALLAGLFVRSLRGLDTDFAYGISAVFKLWVSFAYFGVFAFYGAQMFRQGGRLLRLWCRVSFVASAAGIGGVILWSRGVATPFTSSYRATGGFDDPNLFASYLLIGIALTFVAHARRELRRPYLMVAVQAAALMLTGSRAAIPALAAGVLVALFLGRSSVVLKRLIPWVGLMLGALFAAWLYSPGLLHLDSLSRLTSAQHTVESDIRLKLWSLAWHMWLDHPVIGVGIGQFRTASGGYVSWDVENIAHSTHLSLLAETGVLGYLLVMGLPLSIMYRLVKCARTPSHSAAATWLLVGVGGSLAVAFTLNIENSRPLWAFLGLCMGYIVAAREPRSPAVNSSSTDDVEHGALPVGQAGGRGNGRQ